MRATTERLQVVVVAEVKLSRRRAGDRAGFSWQVGVGRSHDKSPIAVRPEHDTKYTYNRPTTAQRDGSSLLV